MLHRPLGVGGTLSDRKRGGEVGGFGLGEAILIVTMAAAAAIALVGLGVLKRVRGRGESTEFERRVLDELEVLHLRLDMITKRLDDAGMQGAKEDPLLPRGSESGPSVKWTGDDA